MAQTGQVSRRPQLLQAGIDAFGQPDVRQKIVFTLAMLLVIVLVAASFPWGRSSELTVMRQSEDSQPGAPFTGPPSSATGPATAPSTAPADGFPAGTGGNPPPKAQTVPATARPMACNSWRRRRGLVVMGSPTV